MEGELPACFAPGIGTLAGGRGGEEALRLPMLPFWSVYFTFCLIQFENRF